MLPRSPRLILTPCAEAGGGTPTTRSSIAASTTATILMRFAIHPSNFGSVGPELCVFDGVGPAARTQFRRWLRGLSPLGRGGARTLGRHSPDSSTLALIGLLIARD